ncbi:MAG: outer membrane lipoprotein-sorting protein [Gammaproteobacteria bacterium]|nr:outer membrane lipoprotein-sorting protein [Gammaproteobacteria bacterium]
MTTATLNLNSVGRLLVLVISISTLSWALPATASSVDVQQVVVQADRARFPAEPFMVDVEVISTTRGKLETFRYRILAKGNDRSLVQTVYPDSDRGNILLMRDADLWLFLPDVTQPVRLPLSQRLTGQVANGDLARANFAGDYTPKLLRTEPIGSSQYHVIELTAAKSGVTYHRVLYWVDAQTMRPHKAEFYTRSGRHLKTAHYRKYAQMLGTLRPTEMLMEDEVRKGDSSLLRYSGMTQRELPDKVFTKQYLKKLR